MTRRLLSSLSEHLDVFIGFSPERVDPGRTLPRFEDIPKVISGINSESLVRIAGFYSKVFTELVPVSTLETAEMTKLYENCQRLLLVVYTNEMADSCQDHGIDVQEVCIAAATKPFGFSPFKPSLGAGGHCIPVNPSYLLSNCSMPLLAQAADMNRERPIRKGKEISLLAREVFLRKCQNSTTMPPRSPAVLIYGMGFKTGEASLAYAPTVTLANFLSQNQISVAYTDDLVHDKTWPKVQQEDLSKTLLEFCFDVVVVAQSPPRYMTDILGSLEGTAVVSFALL